MPDAMTLVFETSTPHASLGLVAADGVFRERCFQSDRNHNAMLFSPLEELLDGLDCREIGMVLVGSGPGSYSGTRVGIAAAQGVAMAASCPAVAVPSILAVPSAADGARCLAIGDARRGSYWTSMMDQSALCHEPLLCDQAGLAALVAEAVGQGIPVVSLEDPARFPLDGALKEMVRVESPDARGLWAVWNRTSGEMRRAWSANIPQPLYLKPPHITPGKDPCRIKRPTA